MDTLKFRRCRLKTGFQAYVRTITPRWGFNTRTPRLEQLLQEKESYCKYFRGLCQKVLLLVRKKQYINLLSCRHRNEYTRITRILNFDRTASRSISYLLKSAFPNAKSYRSRRTHRRHFNGRSICSLKLARHTTV